MLLFAFPGGAEWLLLAPFLLLYILSFVVLFGKIWPRQDLPYNTKLLWSIFFVCAPIIGLMVYYLFGRSEMRQ